MSKREINQTFRSVLFDLDGTLVDHFEAIHRACAHAMRAVGLAPADLMTIRSVVGGGIEVTMERLVGKELRDQALEHYYPFLSESWREGLRALPGAEWILRNLVDQDVDVAILTNKDGPAARDVCEEVGLTRYVTLVLGCGDSPWRKPDPRVVRFALERMGCEAERSCLIGDSPWDITTARSAGIPVYTVTSGSHSKDQLAAHGPDGIFDDLFQLGTDVFEIVDSVRTDAK